MNSHNHSHDGNTVVVCIDRTEAFFPSLEGRRKPHRTLTSRANSCTDYAEELLDRLTALMWGRRSKRSDSFAQGGVGIELT